MSEERLNEPLATLEAALASLQWRTPSLDRDRLMYLAGQASVRRPKGALRTHRAGWLWPVATAASLLLAVTLGGMLLVSPREQTIERMVYVPVDRPRDSAGAPGSITASLVELSGPPLRTDYLALRSLVLTQGVDAWRMPLGTGSPGGATLTPADAYRGSIELERSS